MVDFLLKPIFLEKLITGFKHNPFCQKILAFQKIAHDLINVAPNILHGSDYEKSLAYIQQACVSFSLRGGTTEILRSVIARGLGLR